MSEVVERGETVRDAYERLREMIIEGVYHPGHHLVENELIDDLGIGRTPLREALRMLQADGYLVAAANRGVRVSRIELGATEDLYAARLLIEPPLLGSLAGSFSAAEIARMEAGLRGMKAREPRRREFQEHHFHFHEVAVARYGPAAKRLVTDLYRRIVWSQRVYMSRPRAVEAFIDLDEPLLEALRTGDGSLAQQLLELHLIDAALGVVLDVEPDHAFRSLPLAARGIGIEIGTEHGRIRTPTTVTWTPPPRDEVRAHETANVRIEAA